MVQKILARAFGGCAASGKPLGHLEKLCFLVPRESDARFAGGKSGVFAMGQLGFFDVSRRYEG
ncbi:MAG: hypothetical protein ACT4O2_01315, partial [Beijerinckiaceae bacterium]